MTTAVDEKDQFKADVNLWGRAHSGWRDPHACQYGVIHTTENSDWTDPVDVAKWQLDTANESSYNILFGTDHHDAKTVRSNDDDYAPWSVGHPGNRLGLHGSAIGYASRDRADWLAFPRQLGKIAEWVADLHTRYGLPLVWLTVEDVRNGVRGFTDHATYWKAIGRGQGMPVRTDPGDGFPHDVVMELARSIVHPAHDPMDTIDQETDTVAQHDLIMDQLVGHPWRDWPGWPQLGGRSLVDGLGAVGAALGVPGMYDTARPTDEDQDEDEGATTTD